MEYFQTQGHFEMKKMNRDLKKAVAARVILNSKFELDINVNISLMLGSNSHIVLYQ